MGACLCKYETIITLWLFNQFTQFFILHERFEKGDLEYILSQFSKFATGDLFCCHRSQMEVEVISTRYQKWRLKWFGCVKKRELENLKMCVDS